MRLAAQAITALILTCGIALGAAGDGSTALAMRHGAPSAMPFTSVHAAHRGVHRLRLSLHAAPRHALAVRAGDAARSELLDLINAERAQSGAAPLRLDSALDAIAQARSQDMVARRYFSHRIPGGGMVFDILDRDHVPYQMAGENIALNNYITFYALNRTVRQTNTDLMNSPEHRANILEPKYALLGLGLSFESGTGKLIVTEVFVQP